MAATLREATACLAIGSVAYSYAGFPLLLLLLAAIHQTLSDVRYLWRKTDRRLAEAQELPQIDVLISAFNEQECIARRIDNLLHVDYPSDRLRVLVGSDGSTDATGEILRSCSDARIRAYVHAINRGKASVLNDLVEQSSAPVLVFSDANTFFDRQALRHLVRHFQDPRVGAVVGELRLHSRGGDNQDGLYWRVEQVLKALEARIGALLGANGAIYAIRRELWQPLRTDTICDDFCAGMNIAAAGRAVVYDPEAWAEEESPPDIDDEYRRRVRIGIGNFQALFRHPEYFTRTGPAAAFAYFSHKVLRWLGPHLLLIGLVASLLSAIDSVAWRVWSMLQLLAYGFAAAAYLWGRAGRPLHPWAKIPAFLFALNLAFLVASVRYLRGNYSGSWWRTQR